ncbi:MAG TPA: hypothetical protein VJP76_00645, partial [Candidatus Tumulicola sp.]|nr:hypothetical protein [Candidatus Tumulicola sp.]
MCFQPLRSGAVAAALLLAACQAATLTPTPSQPQGEASLRAGKATKETLYVAVPNGNAVLGFPSGATGNIAPTANISGSATDLIGPVGPLFASSGKLYVTCGGGNAIDVYPAGAKGNVSPTQRIVGHKTGL